MFRYGNVPLPSRIPKNQFESALSEASDRDIASKYFELDQNNIPNTYVLKNENLPADIKLKLLKLLDGLPFDADRMDILINRSVMEYEARLVFTNESDRDRVFWIPGILDENIKYSKDNSDCNDNMKSYKTSPAYVQFIQWMRSTIPPERIRYLKGDSISAQQFHEWRQDIHRELFSSLKNAISLRQSWMKDGCGLGIRSFDVYS